MNAEQYLGRCLWLGWECTVGGGCTVSACVSPGQEWATSTKQTAALQAVRCCQGQPPGSGTKQGTEGTTAVSGLKPRNDLCKQLKASGCA